VRLAGTWGALRIMASGKGIAVFAGLALLTVAGCSPTPAEPPPASRAIGLVTTLPLLWAESGDIRGQLREAPSHWAQVALAKHGRIVPLDSLAGPDGRLPLARDAILVLAQPRPLTPQENVALDDWVRGGGRVLLFADPLLTAHSRFSLGDPRRPQDVVLLSPILGRWGLELQFGDSQQPGERIESIRGGSLPVDLPGSFRSDGACKLENAGILAECAVGEGRVLAVADAALLDSGEAGASSEIREKALDALMDRLSGLR